MVISKNEKIALKRKSRKRDLLEKIKMDKLYEESIIDPETVEGQSKIDLGILETCQKNESKVEATVTEGWFSYFKNKLTFN